MKHLNFCLVVMFIAATSLALGSSSAFAASPLTAKETVVEFYRHYLNSNLGDPKAPSSSMTYSRSFQKLIDKDENLCQAKSPDDICGFGSDGLIYLDAQDYGEKLKFDSSHFSATETKTGKVEVHFDLFPGEKELAPRSITFTMLKEKGAWVVDDIASKGGSARKMVKDEIKMLSKTDVKK